MLRVLLLLAFQTDYERGVSLFEGGNPQAAIEPLERAVKNDPKNAQAWKALGVVHAAMGDYGLAEGPFRNACERDGNLPDACYFWARALYALNRFEESLAALDKGARSERRPWRTQLARAQALDGLGRAEEAERSFRSAAKDEKADASAGVAYAVFLFRQGRTKEAVEPLNTVLQRYPNAPAANLEMGRVLLQLDRITDALPYLEKAVKLDPSSAPAHLLLSKVYARLGRTADAEREATQGSRTVK